MSRLIKQMDYLILRAVRATNPECRTDIEAIEKEISFYKYTKDLKDKTNIDSSDDFEMIAFLESIREQLIKQERSVVIG